MSRAALIALVACLALAPCALAQTTESVALSRSPLVVGSAVLSADDKDPDWFFEFAEGHRRSTSGDRRPGDLRFEGGVLNVQKFSRVENTIVDLGELDWDQLRELPAARADDASKAPAAAGHAYLVHVNDRAADYLALVRVTSVEPEKSCAIEWALLDLGGPPGPQIPSAAATKMAELLKAQDDNVDPAALLQEPVVRLQLRAGAGGGNPNRIDMLGQTSIYVDTVLAEPIADRRPVNSRERAAAWFSGGRIPPGKCFVVENVDIFGTAAGDSNGHGELIVHVGDKDLVHRRDANAAIDEKWEGHVVIRRGEESRVYAEVANSSSADIVIEGKFVNEADAGSPAEKP